MKKRDSNRIFIYLGVLLLFCAVAGCQKKGEDVPPGLTETPFPTKIEELSPTPAGETSPVPTQEEKTSPAPTEAEEASPAPTEEANPSQAGLTPQADLTPQAGVTSAAGQPSGQEASRLFATVTPVPQEMVSEIADTMSRESFPIIDGSTATIPLSQAVYQLATGEGKEEAEAAIVHTKTTNSYLRLYNGEVDLLIVYEPADSIIERMETEELFIKPIGLDALVFMKNKANPVESLTMEELISIYSGQVKNWAELGGADEDLLAFQRPSGSGSQTLMQKLVMGGVPMEEGDNIFRFSTMSDILEGMLDYTGDDNTLGYSVFYYANFMYSFPELGFMGVNGVLPSSQTIYDGSYPLVNAFYAVIRPDEPEDSNARKIFDWLTGEKGQEMVMDLGYVPMIAPEGIKLPESAPTAEDTVQVLAKKPLEEGQHFIFLQMADMAFYEEYRYGRVIIYDHAWNPCATFYNAFVSTEGLCKDRYITITQNRAKPGGGRESLKRIYDLQENCFVEIPGKNVSYLFDEQKGYVICRESILRKTADGEDWEDYYEQLVDMEGNVLIGYIDEDDYRRIRKEGNCYIVECSPWGANARPSQEDWIYQVYREDFQLIGELYRKLEDMPEPEEQLEGVYYTWVPAGCLMDEDGKILIDREAVLAYFGKAGQEDVEVNSLDYWTLYEDGSDLYRISCDGEECFVDSTMRLSVVGTAQVGNWQDGEVPEDAFPYYWYYGEDWNRCYLSSEGNPMCLSDGTEVFFAANRGREDYILAGRSENGTIIEEYLAGVFAGRYECAVSMGEYDTITYWAPNCFAIEGTSEGTGMEEGGDSLYFYEKDTLLGGLTGDFIMRNYVGGQGYENSWLARTEAGSFTVSGKSVSEDAEDITIRIRAYRLFADGKEFERDVQIAEIKEAGYLAYCNNGYLQMEGRNYIYVYDYNGDVVIKAVNVAMAEE